MTTGRGYRCFLACVFVAGFGIPVGATAAEGVAWVLGPLPLSRAVPDEVARRVAVDLRNAVATSLQVHVIADDAEVLSRIRLDAPLPAGLQEALALVGEAENHYMAFEFSRAAAKLAEASGRLTARLSELRPSDIDRLVQARVLEALAWMEAGDRPAAVEAFGKLLRLRPDHKPDATSIPPSGMELFGQAAVELRRRGFGTLNVQTTPPGAEVWIDGVDRGVTPMIVDHLPLGAHQVRLDKLGYDTVVRTVEISSADTARELSVTLQDAAEYAAMRHLEAALVSGADPRSVDGDLRLLQDRATLAAIVVSAIIPYKNGWLLTATHYRGGLRGASALATVGEPGATGVTSLVESMVNSSWPPRAATLPAGVDFSRYFLGIGAESSTLAAAPVDDSILTAWWFWTGVGVVVLGSAAVTTALLWPQESQAQSPNRVVLSWGAP